MKSGSSSFSASASLHQASKRKRGVILTDQGWSKLIRSRENAEFAENAGEPFTLEELSERTQLSLNTLSRVLTREQGVDKQTLLFYFQSFDLQLEPGDYTRPPSPMELLNSYQDWGEAMDAACFSGRVQELSQLQQWLLQDHCRLIALLGIGGIGKSALAAKLTKKVQGDFDVIIWRSLELALPMDEWLRSVLRSFAQSRGPEAGMETALPRSLNGKISRLRHELQERRCLLVLDNVETVMCAPKPMGQFQAGYEGYGHLLRWIGEVSHQSCLLLTSREKPREVGLLEGQHLPVRSFVLKGLEIAQAQEIFRQKGMFSGTETEWAEVVDHYGGNPLALKLVATAVRESFGGRLGEFLCYMRQGMEVLEDVEALVGQQFERLSEAEQATLCWLAVNQKNMTLSMLKEEVPARIKRYLPRALNSLLRRSLIEKRENGFFLQPLVMDYVLERLNQQVCQEMMLKVD
ncbi:NB-ARC domain-containing protein [Leptolyngbya sp. FACHB-261]|uniref:NB-ARC domain-containing protein n=1 Tax=Leptolyngbya sp. FACHB-261 TaxID=2692806 RepID=UPI001686C691|nr:NB-ARC domain-containing protein [Leptolyngbya sp. FACHB-261]